MIGRNFEDPTVQKTMKKRLFQIINDNEVLKVKVTYKNKETTFYPEQISAMILEELKTQAENFLGKQVKDAVITCPAYFNDGQRNATIDAAKIAGFNIIHIVNEPTAGSIAIIFIKFHDE